MRQFIKYKYIILVVLAALLAVFDLSSYGIPPTHDGEYHVMRFEQFAKVLGEGNIYPRWAPDFNNGFGIPLFSYVYPLPNYFAALTHLIGFGFIDSLKLNMAAATIAGSIFMYLWCRKIWGDLGGLVSSIFYTFSPYHFLDIYVRGSVGEVWALGLAPGLFWAYLKYFETRQALYIISSSVLLALLILSHNILALVFFVFFIAYATTIIAHGRELIKGVKSFILIVITGLGMASPFWLPALLEREYVVGLQVFDPTRHFPVLYKLVYSSWGYGFSGSNAPDQMSFQIGIANIIALFGTFVVLFLMKKRKEKKIILFFFGLLVPTVILLTPVSTFVWKSVPLMSYVQFPWRLLSVVILLISFLAGSIVQDALYKKNDRLKPILATFLIAMAIGFSLNYAKAPFYHERADRHYLTRSNFTDGTNSPGDSFNTKWLAGIPEKEKSKIVAEDDSVKIKMIQLESTIYKFNTNATNSSEIIINTAYFPGWGAEVNGGRVELEEYQGRMKLGIPKGENSIRIFLGNTPIQKLSHLIFIISILLLAVFSFGMPAIINKHKPRSKR